MMIRCQLFIINLLNNKSIIEKNITFIKFLNLFTEFSNQYLDTFLFNSVLIFIK